MWIYRTCANASRRIAFSKSGVWPLKVSVIALTATGELSAILRAKFKVFKSITPSSYTSNTSPNSLAFDAVIVSPV